MIIKLYMKDWSPGRRGAFSEIRRRNWRTVSGGEAYLHDGRARTLEEAILWHGGEARASRQAYETLSESEQAKLIKFLESL